MFWLLAILIKDVRQPMNYFIQKMLWRVISIPFQRAVHWNSDDAKASMVSPGR